MGKGLRDLGNKNVIQEGRGINGLKSRINADEEGNREVETQTLSEYREYKGIVHWKV